MVSHRPSTIAAYTAYQLDDAVDVAMAHAGGRFVQQHYLRIQRERGGDLERPLLAVGELRHNGIGLAGQADIEQQLARPILVDAQHPFRAPEVEARTAPAL
jgi:hypothetical protein